MERVPLLRMPIFWMFLGPPAFRLGGRDAMTSLEGEQDIWNVVRVVWWTFWGVIALIELLRSRDHLLDFAGRLGAFPAWTFVWLLALFASVAVSPAALFTLANVSMFLFLVLAAADLALKLYLGRISLSRVLGLFLLFSVLLLFTVHACYLYDPDMVGGMSYQGWRIRGAPVAYTPILSLIIFFLSLYFLVSLREWARWLMPPLMLYALWWLDLAQTRSGYLALFVGLGVFVWHWGQLKYNFVRLALVGALGISALCGVGLLYGVSHRVTWYVDAYFQEYILRDQYAIQDEELALRGFMTLNGRTEAASVLIDGVVARPLGLGYIAGTRTYMSSPGVIERLPDDAFLGAHNAYLETWAGSGYAGIIGYLCMIGCLVLLARRIRSFEVLPVRILLYVVLIEGIFESELAYPFHQSPVLFWILAASITALFARYAIAASRLEAGYGAPVPAVAHRVTAAAHPFEDWRWAVENRRT